MIQQGIIGAQKYYNKEIAVLEATVADFIKFLCWSA